MLTQALKNLAPPAPEKSALTATVGHMEGMLWYEMLSEMNKSGFSADALGTGGDNFQSMFLWNVAQHDFGKYDSSLTDAMLRQVGGQPDAAASVAPGAPAALPDLPGILLQAVQQGGNAAAIGPQVVTAPSAAPAASSSPAHMLLQAENFGKTIWPQLKAAAQFLGVPAVALLAQTALETGWGSAMPGHNLFGIKATDGQVGTLRATHEMIDGVLTPQTASFRDYPSIVASVADYVQQIQAGFPAAAGQRSVQGFAQALQQGGYATDTNYAEKIVHISQSPMMAQVLQAISAAPPPTPSTTNPTGAS